MEALIEDSVAHIIKYEDPQRFISWLRDSIYNYYTGPDKRQGTMFDTIENLPLGDVAVDPDSLNKIAVNLALVIWNGIPLPSNHFRPQPMPLPRRNEPCHCGSGKKYKQCCAAMPSMQALSPDSLWPLIFSQLDKTIAAQAIRENHVPTEALAVIASDYMNSGQPKKAVTILSPLFEGKIRKTKDDAEFALTILCNAYDDLVYQKKKMDLLQTILDTVSKSPLRSGAWQRLATIRMDDGDVAGAWQAFKHAQRDDPQSLSLGLLEVQILTTQGHIEKAKQRADFWVRQMRRSGVSDDEPQLNFLIEVAANPVEAFAEVGMEMVDDAGLLLKQWLEMAQKRPLPHYTINNQPGMMSPGEGEDDMDVIRQSLLSQGLEKENVEMAIKSMQGQLDDLSGSDESEFPFDDEPEPSSNDFYLQTPADIEALEQEWHRVFPVKKPFSTQDMPFDDADPWDVYTELDWANWLNDHPQAFDSLDILDDLATALVLYPQFGADWVFELLMAPVLQRSESILDKTMASEGVAELPWIIETNRPALRSLVRLGNMAMVKGDSDKVIHYANKLLSINPNDNHGNRMFRMNQLISEGCNEEALKLADQFPEDLNPEVAFGKILALYRLDRKKEAVQEVGEVLEFLDKVPRYLIAKRIKKPKLNEQSVMVGGDDQAWYYREEMRDEWLNTPGALEWLKNAEKVFS
jgi:tetratricopeptide (TPR) repeat protein